MDANDALEGKSRVLYRYGTYCSRVEKTIHRSIHPSIHRPIHPLRPIPWTARYSMYVVHPYRYFDEYSVTLIQSDRQFKLSVRQSVRQSSVARDRPIEWHLACFDWLGGFALLPSCLPICLRCRGSSHTTVSYSRKSGGRKIVSRLYSVACASF